MTDLNEGEGEELDQQKVVEAIGEEPGQEKVFDSVQDALVDQAEVA